LEGEDMDRFEGLGWDEDIVSLEDPHVPFDPSSEPERSVVKRFGDDIELTPFSQSTQAWKGRMEEEEHQWIVKKVKARADEMKKDSTSCEVNGGDDARNLKAADSKKKQLSPHHLPLKERMKDRSINYVGLMRPDPLPTTMYKERFREGCRKSD